MTTRIGIGYDIHPMKDNQPLWLGGILIPFEKGLVGHSDADALLHAVIDALLGAAALGDIGHYFPSSDPKFKGIASKSMLATVMSEIKRAGYKIGNVDTVVVAQIPKIAPHRDKIRETMAGLLGIRVEDVQVKAKTNEGLDAIGQGDAIAAHAVVLLEKS